MRESYRAKQSRKARINREKDQKNVVKRNNQGYNKNNYKNNKVIYENRQEKAENRVQEKEYEDIVSRKKCCFRVIKI